MLSKKIDDHLAELEYIISHNAPDSRIIEKQELLMQEVEEVLSKVVSEEHLSIDARIALRSLQDRLIHTHDESETATQSHEERQKSTEETIADFASMWKDAASLGV